MNRKDKKKIYKKLQNIRKNNISKKDKAGTAPLTLKKAMKIYSKINR